MRPVPDPTPRLSVDLDAVAANARTCAALSGAEVAPVVKADAYGLGAEAVARRLAAEGARSFFVARLSEGVALRRVLSGAAEIFVLDGCVEGAAFALVEHRLTPVLNSLDQIARWESAGGGAAALHVDTGMNRLGLRMEEADALASSPDRLRRTDLTLLMSHLACAGEAEHPMNPKQRDRFCDVAARFGDLRLSLANSGGCFLGAEYGFDLVRPGVALYGGGPCDAPDDRLAPVVTLDLPIVQTRTVPQGETVGYACAWTAPALSRIAIVQGGYADGVLRSASPGAYAKVGEQLCAMIGRISMDLIAIDVSDAPEAREGGYARLLGPDLPVDRLAAASGTLAYEILTRLGPRLERRYIGRAA